MQLEINLERTGFADGEYAVRAKGYLAARLSWANSQGPLPGWSALACVPLDTNGSGRFRFAGGRAIPSEATHLAAELISADFSRRALCLHPLPAMAPQSAADDGIRFTLMSDLHLGSKPDNVRRALQLAKRSDCVLLAGDVSCDGTPGQFAAFAEALEEELPGVPVLGVVGNHDFPEQPLPLISAGVQDWYSLQHQLTARARKMGVTCEELPCGAVSAQFRGVHIYGLNAISHWRQFTFSQGEQLDWLEARLREDRGKDRIVLCHAPLRDHNPAYDRDHGQAYLSHNDRLQEIIDAAGNVLFITGHTHTSPSNLAGYVQADPANGNLYINDSCVAPTELHTPEVLADCEWVDGAVVHLRFAGGVRELKAQYVTTQKWAARGFYRL